MLFRDSASAVAAERLAGSLFVRLIDQFVHQHGHKPSPSEVRSWEMSIPALTNALLDAGLGMVEVLLECSLPLNSKRADVALAGVHPGTGEPSYVVVELKQWSSALPEDGEPLLCRVDAYTRPVLNPIEQVRGYCDYLIPFNGALTDHPERLSGVAFLHNATEFGVQGLYEVPQDERGRLFTAERRGEFVEYLRSKLKPASGAEAADLLLAGKVAPSRQLMAVAAEEVREREQFVAGYDFRSPTTTSGHNPEDLRRVEPTIPFARSSERDLCCARAGHAHDRLLRVTTIDELTQPAIRAFFQALTANDLAAMADAVYEDFAAVDGEMDFGVEDVLMYTASYELYDQSEDGLTVGLVACGRMGRAQSWAFTVEEGLVAGVVITPNEKIPQDFVLSANSRSSFHQVPVVDHEKLAREEEARAFAETTDQDGRTHLRGTARRLDLLGKYYVHLWDRGAGGTIDWINTGEQAVDPDVFRTAGSPASGDMVSKGGKSKLNSSLTVEVGWADTYQKATVRYAAKPYHADSLFWIEENVPGCTLRVTGTLTLTGPGGTVVSSETMTVESVKKPYLLSWSREFALADLPVGDYTLTLTRTVKTGGRWNDRLRVKPHSVTFRVGR
ncbi:hypothetical protein ACIA8O_13135 [Kitasatospora sp. NPDC051853]|uniref:hypothetical protein n=1 Tax=Kitasatospora sp. NPDC051853 TaxID=3364058 RepID=UPI0037AE0FFA